MQGGNVGTVLALAGMTSGIEGLVFSASLMILFASRIAGRKDTINCILVFWMIGVCFKAFEGVPDWTYNFGECGLGFLLKVLAIDTVAFGIGSIPPLAAVLYRPDLLSAVSLGAAAGFLCLSAGLGKVFAAQLIFIHLASYRLSLLFAIILLARIYSPKLDEGRFSSV